MSFNYMYEKISPLTFSGAVMRGDIVHINPALVNPNHINPLNNLSDSV